MTPKAKILAIDKQVIPLVTKQEREFLQLIANIGIANIKTELEKSGSIHTDKR